MSCCDINCCQVYQLTEVALVEIYFQSTEVQSTVSLTCSDINWCLMEIVYFYVNLFFTVLPDFVDMLAGHVIHNRNILTFIMHGACLR